MEPIVSFREDYAFLSNFYSCKIEYNNLVYGSAEAAFQAQKCAIPLSRYFCYGRAGIYNDFNFFIP